MNVFRLSFRAACVALAVSGLPSVRAATFFVATNGNNAAVGTNWATARQTIQSAVNSAVGGDTVLVSNGTYLTGTTVTPGFLTSNRVVITNNILVQSVNGSAVTTIRGEDFGDIPSSMRCVFMSSGTLRGFRLTQGRAPLVSTNDAPKNIYGGGAYAVGGTIEDCIINANDANQGGGVYGGTLRRCTLSGNGALSGGGASESSLFGCVLTVNSAFGGGGGADGGSLHGCTVSDNSAGILGGGLFGSTADGCTIIRNYAGNGGGGAFDTTLNNCLVVSNTAANAAGGVFGGTLNNCTVAYNTAGNAGGGVVLATAHNSIIYFNSNGTNVYPNHQDSTLNHSCTTPMPTSGVNSIISNPLFRAAGDFRLMTNSPCVNAGNNANAAGTTDLDGNPRIEGGTVDMGAYEICRIHYVAPGGASIAPYTRWADAATNIQAAVNVALAGETVVVSNGIYSTGTRVTPGYATSNRVVITNNITVRSANGPAVTTIQGLNAGNSLTSVRCLFMSAGSLSGFTLTGGYAQGLPPTYEQNRDGGGAYMTGGSLSNCWIVGNVATSGFGGGVSGGVLYDCQVLNNTAGTAGGAYSSVLYDSVLSGNTAFTDGGGTYLSDLTRCQITGNTASNIAGGAYGGMIGNSLFSGNSAGAAVGATYFAELTNCTVIGNTSSNVGGVAGGTARNCIVYDNTDVVGNPNFLSMTFAYSCTWPNPGAGVGNFTNNPRFASVGSALLASNSPCINAGNNAHAAGALDLGRRTRIVDGVVDIGAYEFNTYPVHFVAPGGASVSPYSSWANAATNIQDAIDIALPGELVLVSNGTYNTGTRLTPGYASSNRIVLTKDITVRSVNGPQVTVIMGADNGGNYGSIRCAYLSAGILSGFMLTNGATPGVLEYGSEENNGGGAHLAGGSLERCLITGNASREDGGGVYGGTLNACILRGNTAVFGGGAYFSTLNNCAVVDNFGGQGGGGTAFSTLNNCSVVDNLAYLGLTGGSHGDTVRNSIVYHNTVVIFVTGQSPNRYGSTFVSSCTTPLPSGTGNISSDPQFVNTSADLRLQPTSPCINKGTNTYVVGTLDADGNPRIVNGIVDMGAYEWLLTGYWAWAAAITNGLTNYNQSATADGYPNLLKYATGGSPTNADQLSRLTAEFQNGRYILRLNRNTNASDVTLYVETSEAITNGTIWKATVTNKLGTWGSATNVTETGTNTPFTVSIDDTAPDTTNRHTRLRVTRP